MKSPERLTLLARNLVVVFLMVPVCCAHQAVAQFTWDADTGTSGPQDGGGTWNTINGDGVDNVLWPNLASSQATFGANSGAAGTVTVETVNANSLTFNAPGSGNYVLSSGTITLGGTTPTIAANVNATIGSVIAGTAGLTKTGNATLTLTGANTYSGATTISQGTVTYSGTGASTGAGTLLLGTAAGNRAVMNLDSSGTRNFYGTVNIGGGSTGAGEVVQTAGTTNIMNNTSYMQVGNGGYGSYVLSGGNLTNASASGIRVGDNGAPGVFTQTGGNLNC